MERTNEHKYRLKPSKESVQHMFMFVSVGVKCMRKVCMLHVEGCMHMQMIIADNNAVYFMQSHQKLCLQISHC